MILKEVKFKNFRSFAEVHRIAFELGLNVFYGPTGYGKSNIRLGISWGLYAMEGMPSERKEHVPFSKSGVNEGRGSSWVELEFACNEKLYHVGREIWRDPKTGGFRGSVTLRQADAVMGGMDAQRRIQEVVPKDLFDIFTIEGKDLGLGMRRFWERKRAVESALGIPDLVRIRRLGVNAHSFFNGKYRDELSAYEAAKGRLESIAQLSRLVHRMVGHIDQKVEIGDKDLDGVLTRLGELRSLAEIPKSAKAKLEMIEKDVRELGKRVDWFQEKVRTLREEIDHEDQSLEKQRAKIEEELEARSHEAGLLKGCEDLARRTGAAFEDLIKLHEAEKREEINKNINEIFSAISPKPTFGGLKLTPEYEIIVKEMNDAYSPDKGRPSSGEQDLIALSFLFGLGRVASGAECLILDDPTIHFDVAYRKRFISKLPDLGFKQVIILTNDPDLKEIPGASQVIEVWMEGGRSKMKKVR